uniref:Uncharacterized protein n=1 Tax=Tetranychus urticae TaxID=32264 RepID=T1KBW9_TETUR
MILTTKLKSNGSNKKYQENEQVKVFAFFSCSLFYHKLFIVIIL